MRRVKGRFSRADGESYGTYVDEKGYPRISSGPQRGKRVHTLVAEAMLGRELKRDEQVHHIDEDKKNCDWRNLKILNERDHGAVSAKQAWYFKEHDIKNEKEWNEYFDSEERNGQAEQV